MKTILMTGCTSYIGSFVYTHLKDQYHIHCITHTTDSRFIPKSVDILLHIGALCDNSSLRKFKSHISNLQYTLKLIKHVSCTHGIFLSSFAVKPSILLKDLRWYQYAYALTKQIGEILFSIKYPIHTNIRIPIVYDLEYLKPNSLLDRIRQSKAIMYDNKLYFISRNSILKTIQCVIHHHISGTIEVYDYYMKLSEFVSNILQLKEVKVHESDTTIL